MDGLTEYERFLALSAEQDAADEEFERKMALYEHATERAQRFHAARVKALLDGQLWKSVEVPQPSAFPAAYARSGTIWATDALRIKARDDYRHRIVWFRDEKATTVDDVGALNSGTSLTQRWGFVVRDPHRPHANTIALNAGLELPAQLFAVAAHEVGHLDGGMNEQEARAFELQALAQWATDHPGDDVTPLIPTHCFTEWEL